MVSFQIVVWSAAILVISLLLAVGTFSASKHRQKVKNNEELAALQKDFRRIRALTVSLPERYLTDELRSALSVSGVAVLNRMISLSRGRPRYMTEDLVEMEALADQSSPPSSTPDLSGDQINAMRSSLKSFHLLLKNLHERELILGSTVLSARQEISRIMTLSAADYYQAAAARAHKAGRLRETIIAWRRQAETLAELPSSPANDAKIQKLRHRMKALQEDMRANSARNNERVVQSAKEQMDAYASGGVAEEKSQLYD